MQKNNERSDKFKEIIDLILNDKDKGTNLFYQEYIQIITIAVRSVNPDPDKVKSAINTVLITTWQNAKNLREIRNPEGWLYVVARNCAKKENTDRWDSELTEDMHPITNAFDKIEDDDSFSYLIRMLDEDEKEIMTLRVCADYTFETISDHMNKPLSTITSSYYRAKEKIKKYLKKEDFE